MTASKKPTTLEQITIRNKQIKALREEVDNLEVKLTRSKAHREERKRVTAFYAPYVKALVALEPALEACDADLYTSEVTYAIDVTIELHMDEWRDGNPATSPDTERIDGALRDLMDHAGLAVDRQEYDLKYEEEALKDAQHELKKTKSEHAARVKAHKALVTANKKLETKKRTKKSDLRLPRKKAGNGKVKRRSRRSCRPRSVAAR